MGTSGRASHYWAVLKTRYFRPWQWWLCYIKSIRLQHSHALHMSGRWQDEHYIPCILFSTTTATPFWPLYKCIVAEVCPVPWLTVRLHIFYSILDMDTQVPFNPPISNLYSHTLLRVRVNGYLTFCSGMQLLYCLDDGLRLDAYNNLM